MGGGGGHGGGGFGGGGLGGGGHAGFGAKLKSEANQGEGGGLGDFRCKTDVVEISL